MLSGRSLVTYLDFRGSATHESIVLVSFLSSKCEMHSDSPSMADTGEVLIKLSSPTTKGALKVLRDLI